MSPVKKVILAVVVSAVFLGAVLGGLAWLAGTTAGARWLLESVSGHAGLRLSIGTVEGRLGDRLLLRQVRLALPNKKVELDSLELRWKPLLLLAGTIGVQELALQGVTIQDSTPRDKQPMTLSWPRLPQVAEFFDVNLAHFKLRDLSYRRLDEQPLLVASIDTALLLQDKSLYLNGLAVKAKAGRVSGKIAAGFKRPLLTSELEITPARAAAGMESFSLRTDFLPGRAPEQLAGKFAISGHKGRAGTGRELDLSGEVGMISNGFNLRHLHLARKGVRGAITGAGELVLASAEPLLNMRFKGDGLDLAPELGLPTDLSGTLTLSGSLERYHGRFVVANQGKGWRSARISGDYLGSRSGVKLAPLSGSLLGGSLLGNLEVGWGQTITVQGTMRGQGLNPARIAPDWQGVINFDARGGLSWAQRSKLQWNLNARLPESRLHGQALTGVVQAGSVDGIIHIDRLLLQGNGFDIRATGELARRLDIAANVADLSRLIPGTSGQVLADGWLSWRGGHLGGQFNGHGSNLAADGIRAGDVALAARLADGQGYPLQVSATLRKAAYGRFQADLVALEASGTLLDHTMNATLVSADLEARLGLRGAYNNGSWKGQIARFHCGGSGGTWNLAAPTPLEVRADRILLSPLIVTGTSQERLEIAADLAGKPLGGDIRLNWARLNLAMADRLLKDEHLTGTGSGNIHLVLAAGKITSLTGVAGASGSVMANGHLITVPRSRLNIAGNSQGMHGDLELQLAGGGGLKGTFSSTSPLGLSMPPQGELKAEWAGIDLLLFRSWLPGEVMFDGFLAGNVTARFLSGNRLDLKGKSTLSQGRFQWRKDSKKLDAVIDAANLSCSWLGTLHNARTAGIAEKLVVTGQATASATYTADGQSMTIRRGSLTLSGNEKGVSVRTDLDLPGGGTVKASLLSKRPACLAIPEDGVVALEAKGIDPTQFQPWMPRGFRLEGRFGGQVTGKLLPGQQFAMDGSASLAQGKVRFQGSQGEMNLNLNSIAMNWGWRAKELYGDVSMVLGEYGRARGSFHLPLPARFHTAPDPSGSVRAGLSAQVRENGVLNSMFPGFVQESRGELAADLNVAGTWGEPRVTGTLDLAKAGAYLPTAGIQLKDVQLKARLEKDLITIDSFSAVSGSGHLQGTALLRLKGWQIAAYQGSVAGDQFQTIYFPELQVASTPRLTFEGTPQKLTVRGEVRLPELSILGTQTRGVVEPSSDVIVEDRVMPAKKTLPLALDIQVRILLGDRVLVKTAGIDARLGGSMELMLRDLGRINSKGEIRVIKGRYQTYGVNLEIVRGRLYYAGGPINQPTLDILALRTVGDVRAGVTVGGTLQAPVTKLYSEPSMPDVDILAYIVLGHPLGSGQEQADLLSQAAGVLLSSSQSSELQDQIKNRLGLSGLEIGSTSGVSSAKQGYTPIAVTPPGTAPVTQTPGISQTMMTVGKYLTPSLYFRYGRSLFSNGNQFLLRYDIFKQLQVETQTGSESGVDLYYKIEFN